MAKGNGGLTAKSVGVWFRTMPFDEQVALLDELQKVHHKVRQTQINSLKQQLAALENGLSNGHAKPKAGKPGPKKKSAVKVKYRDPKTGGTWSGRGRMATWLAEKVKAGEKADRYLA
jgi:DNA-binding protein H-NS